MKQCEVCRSEDRVLRLRRDGKLYCIRHRSQISRYGRILPHTRFDPAEIIDRQQNCELVIRDKHHNEVARAAFSKRHRAKIAKLKWSLGSNGYPRNHRSGKTLHQIIMGQPPPGKEVDHINGNILDNRDENLRFVTHLQNGHNLKISRRNKSGCRGVHWDKANNAWQVKICMNFKQIFLGRYKDLEEAVRIRREAEARYYGEYTRRAT